MDEQRAPSRKLLPHSRSISLQMLTHTPSAAPLRREMYTESLQPIRSPPSYSASHELLPPLVPYSAAPESSLASPRVSDDGQLPTFKSRQFDGTTDTIPPTTAARPGQERGTRAVSMPVQPVTPYDAMFTFSSELPDDLSRTLHVPTVAVTLSRPSTPGLLGGGGGGGGNNGVYRAEGLRESYISNARGVSGGQSSPTRSAGSGGSQRPGGSRRPSMLHSLGSWLDKRQDSNRTNELGR